MSLGNRIKELIDDKGITPYVVSTETGISQSTLSRIINNVSKKINIENSNLLAKYFGVSKDWLLTGRGEKTESPTQFNEIQVEIANNNDKITTNNNEETAVRFVKPIKKEIPFFDIDFYCSFKVENRKKLEPTFVFYHPDFDRAEFAVRNSGNSMSAVLGSRDIIGMREVRDWDVFFTQGEIYGIVTSNDMRTVKVVRESEDRTKLVLISKPKKAYKDDFPKFEEITKETVLHLFQVVASMCSKKWAM